MIGERVRWYRNLRGLSAQDLADRMAGTMTRSVIANLEAGRKKDVTVTELTALAQALDVAPLSLDSRLNDSLGQWRQGYEQAVRDMQAQLSGLVAPDDSLA